MKALDVVEKHLTPGTVYRRNELRRWSNAVDRHLSLLKKKGVLQKLSGGLYYYPKRTTFGKAPPQDHVLVEAFLKDSRFLMFNPSVYNSLRVGTTQLYNETVVYNHKRHGKFVLGNRAYRFVLKHHFPLELSEEFLLVDLVSNINRLPEDPDAVLKNVVERANSMDRDKLLRAVSEYGSARARKFFEKYLNGEFPFYAN